MNSAHPSLAPGGDWQRLEREDWHLWMLAFFLMFILGVSLLTFMFPTAFWFDRDLLVSKPQRAFFGFCLLLALSLVYMLQRQAQVRSLKRQLYEAQVNAALAEQKAILRLFTALPDVAQFRDSLAMEFLRASHSNGRVASILISLANLSPSELGRVSYALHNLLRPGESLFRVSDNAFGVILPEAKPEAAASFSVMLRQRLNAVCEQAPVSITVGVYPEEVASFAEFEGLLRRTLEQAA